MRLSNKQKEVLKIIGTVALVSASFVAPNILQLLKPKSKSQKYRYKKTINYFVENDIIYLFGEKIQLTPKGKELLKRIGIDEINIDHPKSWDKIWHLVCYDIPEKKKKERDYFRLKLSNLGFVFIQDSLWVCPYECKEEIAVISQSLGISPHVAYLNTDFLPQQQKLIKHFNLNIGLEDEDGRT